MRVVEDARKISPLKFFEINFYFYWISLEYLIERMIV